MLTPYQKAVRGIPLSEEEQDSKALAARWVRNRLIDIECNLGAFAHISVPVNKQAEATKLIQAMLAEDRPTVSRIAQKYFRAAFVIGKVEGGPREVKIADGINSQLGLAADAILGLFDSIGVYEIHGDSKSYE